MVRIKYRPICRASGLGSSLMVGKQCPFCSKVFDEDNLLAIPVHVEKRGALHTG